MLFSGVENGHQNAPQCGGDDESIVELFFVALIIHVI